MDLFPSPQMEILHLPLLRSLDFPQEWQELTVLEKVTKGQNSFFVLYDLSFVYKKKPTVDHSTLFYILKKRKVDSW